MTRSLLSLFWPIAALTFLMFTFVASFLGTHFLGAPTGGGCGGG